MAPPRAKQTVRKMAVDSSRRYYCPKTVPSKGTSAWCSVRKTVDVGSMMRQHRYRPGTVDMRELNTEDLQTCWNTSISKLYGDATTDYSIQIGGTTLKAHKFVLMAQSPVFKSCLGNPLTEEARSGFIRIEDFGAEAVEPMRALLYYCYHGCLSPEFLTYNDEQAAVLFQLADKYLMEGLCVAMEKFLIETATEENVLARAVLAELHSAERLKEKCVQVISSARKTIFVGDEWEELKEKDPKFAADLAARVAMGL